MVKINLLKSGSLRSAKKSHSAVVRTAVIVLGAVGCLCGVVFVGIWLARSTKPVIVQKPPVVPVGLPPSSLIAAQAVEEVVTDLDDSALPQEVSGLSKAKYHDLTRAEQVIYEMQFARKCFYILGLLPETINLRSMTIDSFSTIVMQGLAPSREALNTLLLDYTGRWDVQVLPRPVSTITPNRADSRYPFTFNLRLSTRFGLDHKDPFVDPSLSFLSRKSALSGVENSIARLAEKHQVVLTGGLVKGEAVIDPQLKIRQTLYVLKGQCSFGALRSFVSGLYDAKVPGAFASLSVAAVSEQSVSFTAKYWLSSR
jgi:hypothetical protein